MFSGDSKEAFKDCTLCSMKANEQKASRKQTIAAESMVPLPVLTCFLTPVSSSKTSISAQQRMAFQALWSVPKLIACQKLGRADLRIEATRLIILGKQ